MKILKKIFLIIIICLSINVSATSGPIKQDSIIECNNKYYGNHGNPLHWHEVIKKDDKWVSASQEVNIPACYIRELNKKEKVSFYKCSDGDTARFIIDGEEKKVRFLAIDTPEIDTNEPFSKEASDYTCNTLKNAKEIYLEYDSNSDKEDKYGRILAFIHVDGVLLQKSIISKGLAKVAYIYGDYEYLDELRKEEEKAKDKKIGIWSINNDIVLADELKEEDNSNDVDDEDNVIINILKLIYEIIIKIIALIIN